jgi:hypothetical protein
LVLAVESYKRIGMSRHLKLARGLLAEATH